MNGLETIGIFSVITVVTGFMWFMLFMISNKDGDDDEASFMFASIITILALVTMLALVASEYIGNERKIDEYKEKLSTYEEMETENGSSN